MVVKRMNWKFAPLPSVHQVWMQLFAAGSLLFGTFDLHIFWVKLWRIIGRQALGRCLCLLILEETEHPDHILRLISTRCLMIIQGEIYFKISPCMWHLLFSSVFLIFIRTFVMSWPFQNKFSIRIGNSGKAVVLALYFLFTLVSSGGGSGGSEGSNVLPRNWVKFGLIGSWSINQAGAVLFFGQISPCRSNYWWSQAGFLCPNTVQEVEQQLGMILKYCQKP